MAIQSLNSVSGKDSMIGIGATNTASSSIARGIGSAAAKTAPQTPANLIEPKPEPALEDVQKATKEVQQAVQSMARNLQFSVDQESGKTIVKLTDSETGETIRQFPSQEMIDLSRNIDRLQGLLLKQQA